MRRFSVYLVIAAVLGMAAVGKADDYGGSNNDYGSSNSEYGSSKNDYDSGNNDYSANNNDYSVGNDYQSAPYEEDTTTVVIEGSSPCEPVVTPMYQTVIEDVVNTVIQYDTVVVQQTQVHSIVAQVTSVQIESVSAEQDAVYQVTQTYVCPPPPTVTVNNVNTLWVTETATPTLQVVQTRVQPQVVVQQVTMTQQVDQVDVQTQVIQEQATAVVTTNVHNMVQVVQENVGQDQLTTVVVVPDSGAAGPYDNQPNAAPYNDHPYATKPYASQAYETKPYASQGYASSAAYGS
ncbi:hypothetical protein IW140_000358 [Coemansia sp. RSA 1813]|nr:hypothetical protein EV178_000685 [Coemansia sp. RSA 1646]KAJ1773230.1 hypothetical protein LPJ74_000740 [Coemansia sp. RSA 1843]KAJ2092698.1 hypothetical protein IW138_000792 [Coemansia sp. RSA 986]KAJ2217805.1 hypothetical protein EV179_000291 [Coemansia sp. RSA 487]KAJ2572960.1 hypothetical protein IW140_000358 [Coemansia sp. RSA 1813]